jgi:hypothetical protein
VWTAFENGHLAVHKRLLQDPRVIRKRKHYKR